MPGCVFGDADSVIRCRRKSIPAPLEYQRSSSITLARLAADVAPPHRRRPRRTALSARAVAGVQRAAARRRAPRCAASAGARFRNDAVEARRRASTPARWTHRAERRRPAADRSIPACAPGASTTAARSDAQSRRRALADRARLTNSKTERIACPQPTANLSFLPWVRQGAAGGDRHRRHARRETGRRRRRVDHADTSTTRRCPPVPVRLRGPADVVGIDVHQVVRTDPRPGHQRFRTELLSVDRVRSRRLPLAVHAGARQRERAAAAVAVPGGRAQAGGRAAHEHGRLTAAGAADRRAGEAVRRAARPEGLLGLGACAGRRRRAATDPSG